MVGIATGRAACRAAHAAPALRALATPAVGSCIGQVWMKQPAVNRPEVQICRQGTKSVSKPLSSVSSALSSGMGVQATEYNPSRASLSHRHLYVGGHAPSRFLCSPNAPAQAKEQENSDGAPRAPSQKPERETDRTVYCSGLNYKMDEKALHELVEPHGKVMRMTIPREKTKTANGFEMLAKGYALITLSSMAEAEAVVSALDGKTHSGRRLRIEFKKGSQGALRVEEKKKAVKEVRAKVEMEADTEEPPARMESSSEKKETQAQEKKERQAPTPQPKKSALQAKKIRSATMAKIAISDGMTIKALADSMGVRLVDCIKSVIRLGEAPKTIEHELELTTAELVVVEHGMEPVMPEGSVSHQLGRHFTDEQYSDLPPRAPIVTIMGHVDHGKTTLLDFFRSSSIAAGEAGGITQTIAAFEVERPELGRITFVDTPGHMAFKAMRERGAKATDIVVLVVDVFDGVMPQTLEVVQHTQAAKVPVVIAVNKCDLPGADPRRVLEQLAEHGLVAEDMGGDVQAVPISALKGQGTDKLEECIQLMAEMMELRAPSDGPGEAVVVEVTKDKALGSLTSIIVQVGEIKVGDVVVAGKQSGRVRALRGPGGAHVERAGPSGVAELVGFKDAPEPGEEIYVVASERIAHEIVARRVRQAELEGNWGEFSTTGAPLHQPEEIEAGRLEYPVLVKADVDGAVEAIVNSLMALQSHEVAVRVVGTGVGPVTESDVQMATAYNAVIYTFNLKPPPNAVKKALKQAAVEVVDHKVIYHLLDHVTERLVALLPEQEEVTELGFAEVLAVFRMKGKGHHEVVAGCSGEEIHEGKVASLKRNKDTVPEVPEGAECGICVEGFTEFEEGDKLYCFRRAMIKRTSL